MYDIFLFLFHGNFVIDVLVEQLYNLSFTSWIGPYGCT